MSENPVKKMAEEIRIDEIEARAIAGQSTPSDIFQVIALARMALSASKSSSSIVGDILTMMMKDMGPKRPVDPTKS